MSATRDSTLAYPQELIADLRRQLAERDADLAEAREQQTATAEVLGVINSSPGDLKPVFDAMLERAMRLCEADFGFMLTIDGSTSRIVAERGVPQPLTDFLVQHPPEIGPDTFFGRAVLGRSVLHTADMREEAAYSNGQPLTVTAVDLAGVRALLMAPLHKDEGVSGVFAIFRRDARPFSDRQISLLQNFAAQAVIAMENARLITETREALEQQTATAEVLGVINASPGELAPVFEAMLEKAMKLCEADYGALRTFDGELFHLVAAGADHEAGEALRKHGPIRATGVFGRIARGEPVVHMLDAREHEDYREDPATRERVDLRGIRTWLAVALRKDDSVLGFVAIYRQEVRPFTNRQIALLQNFAAQAVIAMENARLITETREALAQQTATAEILGVINSSPGNLAPVFQVIVEKAMKLCSAAYGSLRTFDGELFHLVADFGAETEKAELRSPARPTGHFAQIARGERIVHVIDARETDVYREDPAARERIDGRDVRTWLAVALHKDGAVLGAIMVYHQEVRPFTDKQIALLENFAAQAVIAMENARLITETREALEQQTATSEVLGAINSSPGDLVPVFDAMLEKAIRLCEGIQGTLWTFAEDRITLAASRGLSPEFVELLRDSRERHDPGGQDPVRRVLNGEKLIQVLDLTAESTHGPVFRAAGEFGGVKTIMVVGLFKEETPLGAFVISRREVRAFTDKQIALLQNFAAQAVIAMENARLITETREALEQQTATAEVLQVINASPGNLSPVFDAMLNKALLLCEAAHGSLFTFEDGTLQQVATAHATPQLVTLRQQQGPNRLEPGTPFYPLLEGQRIVHLTDVRESAAYRDFPAIRERLDAADARSLVAVALRKDGTLLGVLDVYRQEVRPFTDKQIALLQNFAAQAVIAMENARLITETREALEQQTATAEVLQVINSSPGDLTPVFDAMLEKARALGGAAFGTFMLREGERFYAGAVHGAVPEPFARILREGFVPRPSSPVGRLLAGEAWVHIPDLAAILSAMADDDPVPRTAVEAGVRTLLMVPLVKDGELIGLFTNFRQEVRPFTDKQIALLQNFAAQAVIAMENARLLTETREALEQQTATAEVLQVINSSPGDVVPVFDEMLRKAMHLCDAAFGSFTGFDNESFHNLTNRGVPKALADALRAPQSPTPGGAFARLVAGEAIVHIADVKDDDAYRAGLRGRVAMVDIGGARTAIWVALRKEGQLLGAYVIYRQEVRPFSDKQIALLQNFAQQAVIAMENARLLRELRQRTEEVAALNRGLEARVAEQVDELGRVGRLKRFLAPQLAELIVSHGDEKILESHRREIVVVFCDLRGYTAFTETAEPEEVLDFLREYHGALGPLVSQYEGTLDQFSGDGIMVFFNDPVPIPDPAERAVKMAMAMRDAAGDLIAAWRRRGRELGFGAGIAQGYATLGQIGFAERSGYTAIGTVCNVAARLCAEAKDGQILLSQRVAVAVEGTTTLEEIGAVTLKGLTQPVVAYNVPLAASQPALRVIEGGSEDF